MLSLEDTLRAGFSRWIYWFTDSGILRVETISFARLFGTTMGIDFPFIVFIVLLASWGVGPSSVILIVLVLGVIFSLPLLIPEIIQRNLITKPLEELIERKSTIKISWDDVQKATSRGGAITFWTSKKRYVVFSRKNRKEIEDFMRNRIGEKFSR